MCGAVRILKLRTEEAMMHAQHPIEISEPLAVQEDCYTAYAIEARLVGDLPVALVPIGRYPAYLLPDGSRLDDAPRRLEISVPDADWRRGLIPEATSPAQVRLRFIRDGRGGLAKVPLDLPEDLDTGRPDLWAEVFKLVARSLPLIQQVEDEYVVEDARFQDFLKERDKWPRPMSRSDYERLASEMGFQPLGDDDVSEWGDYAFPEYPVDDCRRLRLQQTYAVDLRRARDTEYARQEKERLRRRREEETSLTEALKDAPVSRTYKTLVAGIAPMSLHDDGLHVVISRRDRMITEDSPSLFGSHLLGHEGELGYLVEVEVRGTTGDIARLKCEG
jgi:hypothetical protein